MIVHHRSGPFRTQDDLDAFLSVVVDVIDVDTVNITIPFLAVAHFDLADTGFMLRSRFTICSSSSSTDSSTVDFPSDS